MGQRRGIDHVFEAAFHLDFNRFWRNKMAIADETNSSLARTFEKNSDDPRLLAKLAIPQLETHFLGFVYFASVTFAL